MKDLLHQEVELQQLKEGINVASVKVVQVPGKGRCLLATKDIVCGQVIFSEDPYFTFSSDDSPGKAWQEFNKVYPKSSLKDDCSSSSSGQKSRKHLFTHFCSSTTASSVEKEYVQSIDKYETFNIFT